MQFSTRSSCVKGFYFVYLIESLLRQTCMPIYEFECTKCQNKFDELVRISVNLADIVCPQCGANSPKKLMSAFGFSSGGKMVSSSSSGGCSTCHSNSCSTCH